MSSRLRVRTVLAVLGLTLGLLGGWLASTRVTWVFLAAGVFAVGLSLMALGLRLKLDASENETSDARGRYVRGEFAVDAGIALTTGAVVGVALLLATQNVEESLADRQAGREDVRFVREVATQADARTKPFDGLNLREAQLGGLDLSDAHMSSTVMVDADLSGADLHNANLSRAAMSGADLNDVDLHNADLTAADLSDADLSDADLSPAYVYRTDLSGADLTGVKLSGADLTEADLSGADLRNANLSGADLTDVSLRGANLSGADLSDAFVTDDGGADFQDANFAGADLSDADFSGVDLSGADLGGTRHSGLDVRGNVHDDDTVWPDGFPRDRRSEPAEGRTDD